MNLTDEEIKLKISTGEITALTLDSSIFGRPSETSLEHGAPSKLSQFKDSQITLLMTDIVRGELIEHMKKNAEEAQTELKKTLKLVGNGWLIDRETRNNVLTTLFNEKTPEICANERYQKFVEKTDAQQVSSHEFVDVQKLMEMYFHTKPPFSPTKENKKFEFPDAFALLSLEGWAVLHDTQILVVSKDGDWDGFCAESERLVVVKDLGEALSFFHAESSVATNVLSNKVRDGELPAFIEEVRDAIRDYIDEVDFIINADSAYYYDYDVYEKDVVWTSLEEAESITLFPIASTDTDVEIEVAVNVLVEVSANFTFSTTDSIDKDQVPLGSAEYTKKRAIILSILITIDKEDIESGEIIDIQVDGPKRIHLEYGEVSPDWMSEDPDG